LVPGTIAVRRRVAPADLARALHDGNDEMEPRPEALAELAPPLDDDGGALFNDDKGAQACEKEPYPQQHQQRERAVGKDLGQLLRVENDAEHSVL
jgi:hypothetical protein